MSPRVVGGKPVQRVAVLLFDRPALFETAIACEVWGIDRTAAGVPRSELRLCTPERRTLRTDLGARIAVDHGLEALRWADTIVIPSARKPFGDPVTDERVLRSLRAAHRRGARIATFCSGAFVLAATGLLAGRKATTHWTYADVFRERFPEVELDPNVLYVGGDRLFTSAGTAAGIDLCLHLVRSDWGAEVANIVARRMVVAPHRDGGQAQFVEIPVPSSDDADADLRAVLRWVEGNLDRELNVDELARRAAMTTRTFARRFKQSTGTTPLQWVLHQRVARAQRLLETTRLGVDEIAATCGFGSAAALRQHFARLVGSTPSGYRSSFNPAA
jgi:transcriptional regulator GlxA family with amidase domain